MLQSSGRAVGRYVIYDQMAAGGTAAVHLARRIGPEKFSRIVVMKGLKPVFAVDAELRAMLRDEAWLAARISHPNVVPVIDVESEGDEFWLALEYVHGETLSGLNKTLQGSAVPAGIAASVIVGVLHGLHAAHEVCDEQGAPLGLVHRDVSPQNIIVGVDGVARVLDFGIAKALGRSQATRDGEVKGKLAYMAPEQVFGEPVTRRTDVFATAVVLWEALTGRRLFLGETESETIVRVSNMKVPPPSSLAPVSATLDEVVLRGLERDPEKRYATARDMALALERAVELATSTQVGAWVEALAAETLIKRRALIQRIERDAPPSGEVALQSAAVPTPPVLEVSGRRPRAAREGRTWLLLAALLASFALGALFVWRTQGGSSEALAPGAMVLKESAPVVTEQPPPVVLPAPVGPSELAPAEPTVVAPAAVEDESEPPRKGRRRARGRGTSSARTPAKRRADCDPPYVIDAQGHKRFRVECL